MASPLSTAHINAAISDAEVSERNFTIDCVVLLALANPTLRVLDVASGDHFITLDLAQRLPPTAHVTALSPSSDLADHISTMALAEGVTNVSVVKADVLSLPYPFLNENDAHFDAVHTDHALTYCRDQEEAVRCLLSILKPTGMICMRESIVSKFSVTATCPVLTSTLHASVDMFNAITSLAWASSVPPPHNAFGNAGLYLKAYLINAGIPPSGILSMAFGAFCLASKRERESVGRVWASVFSEDEDERMAASEWATVSVEEGRVSENWMQEYVEAWETWIEDEAGVYGMPYGRVLAFKPDY